MASAAFIQMHSNFMMEANTMNPDQTAPKRAVWPGLLACLQYRPTSIWSKHYKPWSDCSKGSSLTRVVSVCNIGQQSTHKQKKLDDNCRDWGDMG